MKKILVSGYIGFDNFGDEAIFWALSRHLSKLNVEVGVLCNSCDRVENTYGVTGYYYKSLFDVLRAILGCDVLISGGGSLLQNKTSNASLFYYLFIILLAKVLGKKVIIFSQGFEKLNGKFVQLIANNLLKLADFISVRDSKSKDLLSSCGISADLTSDPVYSLVDEVRVCKDKKNVVVQLRDSMGINKEFLCDLAKVIADNEIKEISVFSFQEEYDRKVCIQFIEELEKLNIKTRLISNKSIKETIDIINGFEYMISMRLHGLIVSNALKTRTFALSYDEKIETLSEELELDYIDVNNYSKEEMNSKITKFFNKENGSCNKEYRKFDWRILDSYLGKSGVQID